jgi:hypothetical protein
MEHPQPETPQARGADWLDDQQKHSWEPEVIISGIALAFIFAFPAQIFDFGVRLIQDYGLNYVGALLVLLYLSYVINIFKIFLIVHLCLRFAWAGLLGLSYAFPHGAINEKLFKNARHFAYAKPADMALKMERACSMAFAFPLMLSIMFIGITLYLGALLLIYKAFALNFFAIYLIFLGSAILVAVWGVADKRSKLKTWLATSFYGSIQAIYQSNLGKWSLFGYLFFILGLAIPLVTADLQGLSLFYNSANLSDERWDWPDKSWFFENHLAPGERFPRVMLASDQVSGGSVLLSLAYYAEDEDRAAIINQDHPSALDTLGWPALHGPTDLYRFYLNDSLVALTGWIPARLPGSGQRAYQSLLDVSSLPIGQHELQVEKLVLWENLFNSGTEAWRRKNWTRLVFVKTAT